MQEKEKHSSVKIYLTLRACFCFGVSLFFFTCIWEIHLFSLAFTRKIKQNLTNVNRKQNEVRCIDNQKRKVIHQFSAAFLSPLSTILNESVRETNELERELKDFNEIVSILFEKVNLTEPDIKKKNDFLSSNFLEAFSVLNSRLNSIFHLQSASQISEEILRQCFEIIGYLLTYCSYLLQNTFHGHSMEEFKFIIETMVSSSLICRLICDDSISKSLFTDERIERLCSFLSEILIKVLDLNYNDPQKIKCMDNASESPEIHNLYLSKGKKDNKLLKDEQNSNFRRILEDFLANTANMIHYFSLLVVAVKVSDTSILRVIKAYFLILELKEFDLIKANFVQFIAHVFNKYPHLRINLVDKMIDYIVLGVSEKVSYCKLFRLPEDPQRKIGVIAAVLLSCLQSCVGYNEDFQNSFTLLNSNYSEGIAHVFYWSNVFWSSLLVKIFDFQEKDVREFIKNILEDLLSCLNLPEWPVSSLVILNLCACLLGKFGLQHLDPKFRERAIDIISQVSAKLKTDIISCKKNNNIFSHEGGAEDSQGFIQAESDIRLSCTLGGEFWKVRSICLEAILIRYLLTVKYENLSKKKEMCRYYENSSIRSNNALIYHLRVMTNDTRRRSSHSLHQISSEDKIKFYGELYNTILKDVSNKKRGPNRNLSRSLIIKLNRQLHILGPLAQQNDVLFYRIIGMLDDVSITVRTAGIRSLSKIACVDSTILVNPRVHEILLKRMNDPATLVRCSTLELLGQFVSLNEQVRTKYCFKILDRITDVGVSVRKRVIMILQKIALDDKKGKYNYDTINFNYKLVLRIMDPDLSIQLLVIKYFRKKWFSEKKLNTANVERENSCYAFVRLSWLLYFDMFSKDSTNLPVLCNFPVLILLERILHPKGEEVQSETINLKVLERNVQNMVAFIFEGVVKSRELGQANARNLPLLDHPEVVKMNKGGQNITSEMFAFSLHLFGLIEPGIFVPDNDPFYFIMALQPYFHSNGYVLDNKSLFMQSVLSLVNAIIRQNIRFSVNLSRKIVDDMCVLILRSKYFGTADYATKCLCSLASMSTDAQEKLVRLMKRFMLVLFSEEGRNNNFSDNNLADKERALKFRAIFVLGKIMKYKAKFFLDSEQYFTFLGESSENGIVTILKMLQRYALKKEDNSEINKLAVEACGSIFISMQNFNATKFSKVFDDIMHGVLHISSNYELKLQGLKILEDIICEEDSNIILNQLKNKGTNHTEKMQYAEKIQGENGELDSGNANCIQRFWKEIRGLCADSESKVRMRALQLVEVIIRKGLVHPLSAFSSLLQLNCDRSIKIRTLAFRLFKVHFDKYANFFYQQLSEAIEQLFHFMSTENNRSEAARNDQYSNCIKEWHFDCFKNIFGLVVGNRIDATRFLDIILKLLTQNVCLPEKRRYVEFLSYLISCLPFSSNTEPIYAICKLQRIVILRAAPLARLIETSEKEKLRDDEVILMEPESLSNQSLNDRKHTFHLSVNLTIILQLKQYLQRKFKLSEEQFRSYNLSTKSKSLGCLKLQENIGPLQIVTCDLPLVLTEEVYRECTTKFLGLLNSISL